MAGIWHAVIERVSSTLRQGAEGIRCRLCVCKRISVGLCPLAEEI